jgi:hypothetical protein
MFKTIVITLSGLILAFTGVIALKASQTPEVLAQHAAQQGQAARTEALREQLINRVTQPYNRMVYMCDYSAQFSHLAPQAQLPSKCAQLRTAGREAIARMRTMTDLDLLSRQVAQFEITVAPEIQTMEAAYATVRKIMK